ncbi:MAG: rRNA maturation RNase YbeY [Desulfarculus sp.]|jgi:probable rRNA maturation factor|nr:MAG: rRNA maturation RNase YbeY [Desulfarculus sp.]
MPVMVENRAAGQVDLAELLLRVTRVLSALGVGPAEELSLLIVDDEEMAELNRRWLGRQGPTNVLAFSQREGPAGPHSELLGDVVVSQETCAREVVEHDLEPDQHLLRLIIHGVLHLLGYEHEQGGPAARRMEELTEQLLAAAWAE